VIYNKTLVDLLLTFSDGDTFIVLAQTVDIVQKSLPNWIIQWTSLNTSGISGFYIPTTPGTPVGLPFQQVTVVAWQPGEPLYGTYPAPCPVRFPPDINSMVVAAQVFTAVNVNTSAATINLRLPSAIWFNPASLAFIGAIIYHVYVYSTDAKPTVKLFQLTADPAFSTNAFTTYNNSIYNPAVFLFPFAKLESKNVTQALPGGNAFMQQELPTGAFIDLLQGIPFFIPIGNPGGGGLEVFVETSAATAIDYGVFFVWGEYTNF